MIHECSIGVQVLVAPCYSSTCWWGYLYFKNINCFQYKGGGTAPVNVSAAPAGGSNAASAAAAPAVEEKKVSFLFYFA